MAFRGWLAVFVVGGASGTGFEAEAGMAARLPGATVVSKLGMALSSV